MSLRPLPLIPLSAERLWHVLEPSSTSGSSRKELEAAGLSSALHLGLFFFFFTSTVTCICFSSLCLKKNSSVYYNKVELKIDKHVCILRSEVHLPQMIIILYF